MATRFYLTDVDVPAGFNHAFSASWSNTSAGIRRMMFPFLEGTPAVTKSTGNLGNLGINATFALYQGISPPLAPGTVFTLASHNVRSVVMMQESATNDNINRQPTLIKIVDYEGAVTQATLRLFAHVGPNTNEWLSTGLRNKQLLDGDALTASYTTVEGDRILFEFGGQVSSSGGTSVDASYELRADSGTDLPENETNTTSGPCWIEFSNTFTLAQWWYDRIADLRGHRGR